MSFGISAVESFEHRIGDMLFCRDCAGIYPDVRELMHPEGYFWGVSLACGELRLFPIDGEYRWFDDGAFYDFGTQGDWKEFEFPRGFLKDFRRAYFDAFPMCHEINSYVCEECKCNYVEGDPADDSSREFVMVFIDAQCFFEERN